MPDLSQPERKIVREFVSWDILIYLSFLAHYITLETGDVLNNNGYIIGEHVGALVYTIGQRHGFTITTQNNHREALYVVSRDIVANTITVDDTPLTTNTTNTVTIQAVQLIGQPLALSQDFKLQTRYRQTPVPCKTISCTEGEMHISILGESDIPVSGQSCVLYDGPRCLGGGIIA